MSKKNKSGSGSGNGKQGKAATPTPAKGTKPAEPVKAAEAEPVKAEAAKPEAATVKPEAATAKPEAATATAKPEAATAKPEAETATAKPEAATATATATATAKPEAETAKPEPATAKPEPATAKPEAATAKPAAKPTAKPVVDDDDDDDDEEDDDDDDDDDEEEEDEEDARPLKPKVLPGARTSVGGAVVPALTGAGKPKTTKGPDIWDTAALWIAKNGPLPALVILTGIVAMMYIGLFSGEIAGDDLTFHLAESARLSDCIRVGDFDWWNPAGNGGYASAYYYQVVPQLASAIPAAIFGHLLFWFQLSNWLPLVLAPAAAYRGLRMLGASKWQAFGGAFCVAMYNGESRWGGGAAGSFHVGLYTQTWALSAFPMALGYCGRWIMKGEKLAPAVAWGAFVALCHPFAWIGLAITLSVGWFVYIMPARRSPGWPSWVGTLVALLSLLTLLIPETSSSAKLSHVAIPVCMVGGVVLPFIVKTPNNEWTYKAWRHFFESLARLALVGVLMVFAWMPVWLPLLVDYAGFGGFPHRVGDEIGPGFITTLDWFVHGKILDFRADGTRLPLLTYMLPVVASFARGSLLRWMWAGAATFAFFLGIGPHMSTTQDDLLPMVRFLGCMQTLLAMGIGAGLVIGGQYIWRLVDKGGEAYLVRTILAATASALLVLIAVPGYKSLNALIHTMPEWANQHHDELMQVSEELATLPGGRKQSGPGTENHWWNLLPYVYGKMPALLQMGGGGLQSSPNYDYLWTERDYTKNAWIYDAPYVIFARDRAAKAPPGDTIFETKSMRFRVRMKSWLTPSFTVEDGPGNYLIRKLPAPGLISPVEVTGVLDKGTRKGDPGHNEALEWLKGDLPLADHVLAYNGFGGISQNPPDAKTISWKRQLSPGDEADMVAQVEVKAPTTFIVRESWHPRWHAYIDGNEVPVRRVTPDFPAVDVPVGTHEIAMRFERPWWALADWLAFPGVALGAWLLLRRWRKKHPLVPEPEPELLPLPRAQQVAKPGAGKQARKY